MRRPGTLRTIALFATAVAGLLAAHELDYRLIVPDPAHRHDLLMRTGHGYLSRAGIVMLAAGMVSAFTAIALGYARASGRAIARGSIVAPLALVQSGGFVALEAFERVIVGAPPGDRLLVVSAVGVVLQIATAVVAALLLRGLERAGALVARAGAHGPAYPQILHVHVPDGARVLRSAVVVATARPRAPPIAPIS